MPRSLPSLPSVRFLQKEAKDLLKAHKSSDVSCCPTLRYHFRFSRASDEDILKADVSLQEVQHALALDYGFKDWTALKAHAETAKPVAATASIETRNKAIIRELYEAQNGRDLSAWKDLLDPRFVERVDGGTMTWDRDYVLEQETTYWENFPDVTYVIESMVAEGDTVVVQLRVEGTRKNDSYKSILHSHMIYRLQGGKVIEASAASARNVLDPSGDELRSILAEEAPGSDATVDEMFKSIILNAVADEATDLHLEPMDHGVRIRRRVDGALYEAEALAEDLGQAVIAAGMRMAGLDPEQRSKSQDGRLVIELEDGRIDCRMSSVPGSRGTVLAVRPIDTRIPVFALDRLDFEGDQEERYRSLIGSASGVIVVTGPTGSGKTTTLYATLSELNDPTRKIVTVEDPVEYLLEGIDQLPVRPDFGFETALRSVLRQAPNVIMAGEIRSVGVGNLVIQAALTGHLVFTTLHADTAPGAYARMTDMGLEPFLVRDAVRGVLAQRLLRRLCPECKEAYTPDVEQLAYLGINRADAGTLWQAAGCDACQHRGYKGRVGVFSLLEANDGVKQAIMTKDAQSLVDAARATGWLSLREIAIKKLLRGETTLEEVIKFT